MTRHTSASGTAGPSPGSRERILTAATHIAQAHGYGGLNFRDLAEAVGIKAASIYHHFDGKADLGAAVARRYWQGTADALEELLAKSPDPLSSLHRYPELFRKALESGNRICLCSFMAAETDDLPEVVKAEVKAFQDVNIAWLTKVLSAAAVVDPAQSGQRARAIFAAIAGAQLVARSHADIAVYDALVDSFRSAGLLPA
ncbi:TetR/AcrR family transcriptional regulator [Cupriavidus gilardii]|uniref:TetR/AcrR family transcriptional regulator n=1 Tax=Cupriavidus gilardii TaxID=82541 RepID=A0A849BEN4_9BURK|nr:TetR/AcrR family transcriptional regulator [Cupriavidus gilardii]KAB0597619.1 TetR/AcrR family transcriptional regulator [Cupriavidus gilardii]MCT9014638.1 TetR/AcrR family transcriptional regulator [Cupriavidus gilardii]MCT9054358.1 TetR/AcrR family transcriptional regulator [Cupriavidus gilardii]NNH12273.1 TetR/AcrR family transcriptional regulator [Cupriavidus gilardii]WNG68255.1 TetR/AcrR family transcriptional regulator [Cupriavidus gilardii]